MVIKIWLCLTMWLIVQNIVQDIRADQALSTWIHWSIRLMLLIVYFYRPPSKLREGNVFSRVCASFCSQGLSPCNYYQWYHWSVTSHPSLRTCSSWTPKPSTPRGTPSPQPLLHPWICSNFFIGDPPPQTCLNLLVSTYVVCERLSVMHEPAGVVEILVQILQFTPILKSTPLPLPLPPPTPWKLKFRQILALWLFSFRIPLPPPLKIEI